MGKCVTNRRASIFKKAKKDTLTSALFRDPLGTPRQFVFILTGKVLHVPFIRSVSQITYKRSV